MNFWLLIFSFIFLNQAHAREVQVHLNAIGEITNSRLAVSQANKASFSGNTVGANILLVTSMGTNIPGASLAGYGLGLVGSYLQRSQENTANKPGVSETLEGNEILFGGRLYGLGLFLGLNFKYSTLTLASRPAETKIEYKGLGVRFEGGLQINLGPTLTFTPVLHYDISNISSPDNAGASKRLNDFGMGVNLGFRI